MITDTLNMELRVAPKANIIMIRGTIDINGIKHSRQKELEADNVDYLTIHALYNQIVAELLTITVNILEGGQ